MAMRPAERSPPFSGCWPVRHEIHHGLSIALMQNDQSQRAVASCTAVAIVEHEHLSFSFKSLHIEHAAHHKSFIRVEEVQEWGREATTYRLIEIEEAKGKATIQW